MPFDGRILSGVSVLAAVVDGGSFVKAAELIGLTDSGVSRAISRLETRLGVRLLDRTTRSVTLTDEGRRFYEEVKPHLSAIEDAATVAAGAVSAVRGRLRIDIDLSYCRWSWPAGSASSANAIPNSRSSS
jgi:DNA-binding transcriptional LysR family regulator